VIGLLIGFQMKIREKLGLNIESIREAEDQKNKATKWTDLALEDFTNH